MQQNQNDQQNQQRRGDEVGHGQTGLGSSQTTQSGGGDAELRREVQELKSRIEKLEAKDRQPAKQ